MLVKPPHLPRVTEERAIIEADFEVVGGPYRVGDEHRTEKDWFFTGRYDAEGNPYFIRGRKWWERLIRKHQRRRVAATVWRWIVWGGGGVALAYSAYYFLAGAASH